MTRSIFIAAALALAVTLPAVPAQAQSIRTFVSTSGSDANPCSITQPCRHFSAAVAVTSVGGEVDALDPGAYGSFTISQAVTIEGQSWSYVAPPTSGAAITINAVSGVVNIHGVSLNGVGVANSTGILFNSGTTLNVQNSAIRNFGGNGVSYQPNSSTSSQIFVSNTMISDNGGYGIAITPSGSGTTSGVLNRVETESNGNSGLFVSSATQTINVTVTDSVSANNVGSGVFDSSAGPSISTVIRNSTIANNAVGLQTEGAGATILVTRSTITGNGVGWNGVVESYADNNIDGNSNVNTAPAQIGYK